jgi:serine/threonine protein kinase
MKEVRLGNGAYGVVVKRDGYAYKKFDKLSHLIQEFCAGSFLRNARGIIRIHSADYYEKELKMDLYDMNLREFMERRSNTDTKRKIFYDICIGLSEIHRRHMVHGDIKPGNILIRMTQEPSGDPLRGSGSDGMPAAFIGDLGFVSLAPYSKVRRTTAVYRDEKMLQDASHDIYSLGIVALEFFGDMKVYEKLDHPQVQRYAKKHVKNRTVRQLIISMTDPDYEKRPNIEQVVESIFNTKCPSLNRDVAIKEIPDLGKYADQVYHLYRGLSKRSDHSRSQRGYRSLIIFFSNNRKALRKQRCLHVTSMILILSALFGRSHFALSEAIKWCARNGESTSESEVVAGVATLLSDYEIVKLLMKH